MAFTQADLAAVESAIARGEQTVQFSDRTTTYRSLDSLLKAREVIRQALSSKARTAIGVADKGL